MKGEIQPPTYFAALLILSGASHFAYPVQQVVEPPYAYLGLLLIAFGAILNLWADSLFKNSKTTVKPQKMPSKLVVSGPFRIRRHPMYLGMAAILLGEAVFLGVSRDLRLSPDLRGHDGGSFHLDGGGEPRTSLRKGVPGLQKEGPALDMIKLVIGAIIPLAISPSQAAAAHPATSCGYSNK